VTRAPATEAVWAAMSADLRRWLRRRAPDEHAAEDMLQETFLRIHRRLDSLQDAERLGAWVTTIARHVLLDHARRRAARPEHHGDAGEAVLDGTPSGDEATGSAGARPLAWVADAIDALPETYREAVRLSELEGLTGAQVAERLGLTVSGAKSRVQRGRALLKQALDACCRFEFDRRGNLLDWERRGRTRPCGDSGDCGG
jgi:RNA polymerase sigma-70 factor (ECF subfamily)